MLGLSEICQELREDLERRNAAATAPSCSRDSSSDTVRMHRAIHRRDWDGADAKLGDVEAGAAELKAVVADYPALYHTGYTQDALKEVAEAYITRAIIGEQPLPQPAI